MRVEGHLKNYACMRARQRQPQKGRKRGGVACGRCVHLSLPNELIRFGTKLSIIEIRRASHRMRHARTRTGCRVAPVTMSMCRSRFMSMSMSLSMSCVVMNSRPVAPSALSGQTGQVMRQAAPHVLWQCLYLQYLPS